MKMYKTDKLCFTIMLTVCCLIFGVTVAAAKSYSFSWSASTESIDGYRLYYKKGGEPTVPFDGSEATEGTSPITLGKVTSFTISGLEDNTTYHFALTAYTGAEESSFSEIITVFPDAGSTDPDQTGGGTGDPLSAVIGVDIQTGEAPLTVQFNGSGSTGDITAYSWNFGDGRVGTGSSPSHVYEDAGSFTAILTVQDGSGNTEQASVGVTVSEAVVPDLPVADFSLSTINGTPPLAVSFDGSGSTTVVPPITAYSWDFGDNSTGSGAKVDHTYTSPGVYTVRLTVEDSNGVSEAKSQIVTVTEPIVSDPLVASVSTSVRTGIVPLTIDFDGSASTGDIATYSWDFGDSSEVVTGATATHVYGAAGTYNAVLTVADSGGEVSQKSTTIIVNSGSSGGSKSYSFSWSASTESIDGYRLYYKKGGEPTVPFDGTEATEGTSPITLGKVTSFTISGLEDNTTYHFALTAYTGVEESSFSEIITVFPDAGSTDPDQTGGGTGDPLSAVIGVDNQTGEAPLTVQFNGSGSTGDITKYSWNFGDGDIADGSIVNHNYSTAGLYTASLTIVDGNGLSVQDTIEIEVSQTTVTQHPPPEAIIEVDLAEGEAPFKVLFTGTQSTSTDGATIISYEWDFGDGSEPQYGGSVEHVFSETGTYLVVLKVADSNGNFDETSIIISVNAPVVEENPDPIAVFTQTSTVGAVPFNIEFDASASSDPDGDSLNYSWTFGDGAVASGAIVAHTYTNTGVFSVKLTVEDGSGATAEISQTIAVLTDSEYKRYLDGKKVRTIINIINTLLLQED